MRFLITGARGLLGAEWVRALTPAYEVVATDRPEVDLTDRAASSACVAEAVPDLILHGAAYTTVDQAEAEPERRYAANVLATGHVLITPPPFVSKFRGALSGSVVGLSLLLPGSTGRCFLRGVMT